MDLPFLVFSIPGHTTSKHLRAHIIWLYIFAWIFTAEGELFEGTPGGAVKTSDLFKGKKVVLFGVPGAFTPGCSKTHLPGTLTMVLCA